MKHSIDIWPRSMFFFLMESMEKFTPSWIVALEISVLLIVKLIFIIEKKGCGNGSMGNIMSSGRIVPQIG